MGKYLIEAIEREKTALDASSTMPLQECERVMAVIEGCKGKVIFCGVGKPAYIGAGPAAAFALLGIPSFFVHVMESAHGDLGMIEEKDIVTLTFNSGTTQEVIQVLTLLHSIGCMTVACYANRDPMLAEARDLILIYPKATEADACNFASASFTTLVSVLDDATVCVISKKRGFNPSDSHKSHPGGSFGKRFDDKSCI